MNKSLHLCLDLPDRRHVVLIAFWNFQTVLVWRDRPFPRAPQWQFEIQHLSIKGAWRVHWRARSLKPRVHKNERLYHGVWITFTRAQWGSWSVCWGYELPSGLRRLSPSAGAA